jgi:hypothetical protein
MTSFLVDAWLMVLLFQLSVSVLFAVLKYATTHHARSRARAVDAELTAERARAHTLNAPSTFVQYAKSTRRIHTLEKELAALQTALQHPLLLRCEQLLPVARLVLVVWFWNTPMFVLPHDFFWPVSIWLRQPGWPADTIGVVAWSTICTAVANTLLLRP